MAPARAPHLPDGERTRRAYPAPSAPERPPHARGHAGSRRFAEQAARTEPLAAFPELGADEHLLRAPRTRPHPQREKGIRWGDRAVTA
ncbi:hypothetical protein ACWEN3_20635 [Streptomyces sp. NPDC004561]